MSREDLNSDDVHWELDAGPETCGFCLRAYHYEAGYYCVECDRPICPLCVVEVRVTRTTVCPDCHPGGD